MSDFKREERYIVFKIKELTIGQTCDLRDYIAEQGIKTPECTVVESDWPNYEHVWQTIEQVANGTFDPDEITHLQAKSEALQERVAELEDREDAMCDLSYANGAKQGFSLGQMDDNSGIEQIVAPRYSGGVSEIKRLRTQASALERQSEGGE